MKKKCLLLSSLLMLIGTSAMQAQTAYTYVQQKDAQQKSNVVTADGTAAISIASGDATFEFDSEGNAVMTIGGNTVAKLPVTDGNGGELCADYTSSTGAGTLPVTVTEAGYATVYSPFQLQVPTGSDVYVYAPTYNSTTHELNCTTSTKVAEGAIIPVGTALILQNKGDITFGISAEASTDTHTSDLLGSALVISKPTVDEGNTVFTLGYEKTTNEVGFFSYSGTTLAAGKAYLIAEIISSGSGAKFVAFNTSDIATDISQISELDSQNMNGKYIENNRVVIVKNGRKFNLNGQEIK